MADIELAALNGNGSATTTAGGVAKSTVAGKENPIRQFKLWLGVLMVFAIGGLYLFVQKEPSDGSNEQDVERKIPLAQCPAFCNARATQLKTHHGGDLLDAPYLVQAVEGARTRFHEKLQQDYGKEAFASMFTDPKLGNKVVGEHALYSAKIDSDVSYVKFRRKLQMKVLQVQIAILEERNNLEGCDCTQPTKTTRRLEQQQQQQQQQHESHAQQIVLPEIPSYYERFIWSTGGHSAAAAHGNLYNESYTAFLERGVEDLFSSVGLQFKGRNYAMGGMDSAPQLALCNEAVYGLDADVISWDFGMTDGGANWKTTLYASRAGVHVNRPVHVGINMMGRKYKQRTQATQVAEDAGVPTLVLHPQTEEAIVKGIPDAFGMPREEAEKIGPYARDFKCKGAIEKEEPCQDAKYNNNVCPGRKFKASWHPGFRQHALTGNIVALFFVEAMVDAMKDLQESLGGDPRELLAKLKAEEDAEYEKFLATTVPDETEGLVSAELVAAGLKSQELFRNKAICKTSLLPAQTRYMGFLTESDKVGEIHGYDEGIEVEYAAKQPPIEEKDKGDLALVFEQQFRQVCDVDLNVDYKDFFYATQDWGWASLKFPNDAELKAYGGGAAFQPAGVVMICFVKCDWGKCPPGEVTQDGFKEGKWKLTLNGNEVTELSQTDQCYVVKTKEDGYYNKPNPDTGRYELKVWIAPQGNERQYVRITTIIVV